MASNVISKTEKTLQHKKLSMSREVARVVESYESRAEDGLRLEKGDEVQVLDKSDSYWWKGKSKEGKVGLFPCSRVVLVDSSTKEAQKPNSVPKPSSKRAVVGLYSFVASGPDELSFEVGDEIEVLAKSKSGWWKGRIGNREGLFPANRTSAESEKGSSESDARFSLTKSSPSLTRIQPKSSSLDLGKAKLGQSSNSLEFKVKNGDDKRSPGSEEKKSPLPEERKSPRFPSKSNLEDDANKLKSPSPRRVLEMFKFGKKTKKEPAAEPDIEHPFEQKSDHFSLLEQADAQQSSLKPVAKEDAATAHRKRHGFILAELIQTEKDYVEDLEMIVELFLVPLRANKLVNKEEADGVFGNLPHLIPLNRHLLDKIKEQSVLPPEKQNVGGVFKTFFLSDGIKEYAKFAAQSQLSGRTLLQLSKSNASWSKFLNETYRDPKLRDLKLDTYLIKPIQRICRYPLLLTELQRATPDNAPDKKELLVAMDCLSGVISEINETRRESEILHHVVELENSLKGLPADLKLVCAGRTFLREAQMEKLKSKNQRRRSPVMLWMFSDCLVWGKIKVKSMEFNGVAMFNACLLHNLPDAPAKDLEHAFEIMVFPNKESVAFCCINAAQKNEWVSELTHLIDKSLQDASKKLKQSSTNSLPSPQAKQESPPSVMSNAPVPVRKKAIGGGSLIRTTKASVRVKGDVSARVTKLRDEMRNAETGVEMSFDKMSGERYFSGRAAVEWTMQRFALGPEQLSRAMDLMSGLLHSGVIEPCLDTSGEDFLYSFTAYYMFLQD